LSISSNLRGLTVRSIIVFLCFFILNTPAFAEEQTELYKFASPIYQERFRDLTHQFRCLVCQNQTLADSNAPLAVDMKNQILQMINGGSKDQEITDFLTQRYGDFISYQPPFNRLTFLLWFGPLGLLIFSASILIRAYARRS
jgi:cytochrome c-type biogenesis protein CcmH